MDLIWNSSSIDKQLLWNNEKIIVFQNLFKNASAVPKFAVFFDIVVTKYFKKYFVIPTLGSKHLVRKGNCEICNNFSLNPNYYKMPFR